MEVPLCLIAGGLAREKFGWKKALLWDSRERKKIRSISRAILQSRTIDSPPLNCGAITVGWSVNFKHHIKV